MAISYTAPLSLELKFQTSHAYCSGSHRLFTLLAKSDQTQRLSILGASSIALWLGETRETRGLRTGQGSLARWDRSHEPGPVYSGSHGLR